MQLQGQFETSTATVRCEPSGRTATVVHGTNLLDAITQLALPLAQSCDKVKLCGFCRIHVLEGRDSLSPAGEPELKILRALGADDDMRLACIANVNGNVVVRAEYW